jgi:hypothetical protein
MSIAVSACSALGEPHCAGHEQSAVQDSLYFGTGRATGVVTSEEWSKFLEVRGHSSLSAGSHRVAGLGPVARSRRLDRPRINLRFIACNDAQSEASVAAIVAAYKAQFRQEAVLRVRAKACISF